MQDMENIVKIEEINPATLKIAGQNSEYRIPIRTLWADATELKLRTSFAREESRWIQG